MSLPAQHLVLDRKAKFLCRDTGLEELARSASDESIWRKAAELAADRFGGIIGLSLQGVSVYPILPQGADARDLSRSPPHDLVRVQTPFRPRSEA